MEDSTSILSMHTATGAELNIQRPMYNNVQSKLIEAENKLNKVFDEYSGRIESFMMMMDMLNDGVWIINPANETCYLNEAANSFIKKWPAELSAHICYHQLIAEKKATIKVGERHTLNLRINNMFWSGEHCNFVVVNEAALSVIEAPVQSPAPIAEPFQPLINYLKLIAEHEIAGNTTEANVYALQAMNTIATSEKLMSDAKAYMALLHYKPVLTQVSMQKIAGDVLKSMGPEIEDAEIEISISELPETNADKELITKLLKHLIGNALKFRNKSRKGIIDIGHDKSDGQYIFCVRDNGMGISKKHHDEVFNLFTSLHNRDEYPGNGIGLAICKKIVELHNGTIWVESLPGHGSNFYFKLNTKA